MKLLKRSVPETEPITLAQAREFLRLDTFGSPPTHPEDNLITVMITAARSWCENYANHSIAYRTTEVKFDKFNSEYLDLQEWPVTSIDSVTYIDTSGVEQTLSASEYILDTAIAPARLYPVETFPNVKDRVNAVTVTFKSGYTDTISPNDYPTPTEVTHAIYLMLAHFYQNRQQVGQKLESLPYGVEWLLHPHRIDLGV